MELGLEEQQPERLLLASGSPRRRQLLESYGYAFETVPAGVQELCGPHWEPNRLVLANAELKARWVSRLFPGRLVLGADTVVVFRGRVFGKPADWEDAHRMLAELQGNEHEVLSGVCLVREKPAFESHFVETTRVRLHALDRAQREAYLQRIGPLDKAGAYAAQEDLGELISSISGSLTNVIGLPMEALGNALVAAGITSSGRFSASA